MSDTVYTYQSIEPGKTVIARQDPNFSTDRWIVDSKLCPPGHPEVYADSAQGRALLALALDHIERDPERTLKTYCFRNARDGQIVHSVRAQDVLAAIKLTIEENDDIGRAMTNWLLVLDEEDIRHVALLAAK